jgi:Ser/Thr protein kinase RdoA (MazF antagonist)
MVRPWSENVARQVCDKFVSRLGLSEARPKLISFRQNAIFFFPDAGFSLRIYGPGEDPGRAALMVNCARWLESHNFPAVRLAPVLAEQPLDLLGYQISVWQWVKQDDSRPNSAFLYGRLLRDFHALPSNDELAVPAFDPVRKIRNRLDRMMVSESLSTEARALLEQVFNRVDGLQADLRKSKLGQGVIHGDAMTGNAIQRDGQMVMIDLDSVTFGPREWDLAPMAVASKRMSRRGQARWQEFLEGYGVDESDLAELHAASVIKQFSMTVYLCLSAGQSAEIDEEIGRRLRMWAEWDLDGHWSTGFTVAPDH